MRNATRYRNNGRYLEATMGIAAPWNGTQFVFARL